MSSTSGIDYLSVEQYSEKQMKAAVRLLEIISRNDIRLSEHYGQIRSHQRKKCHNILFIRIPHPSQQPISFSVYMRDISPGGTSFLYPGEIGCSQIMVGIPIHERGETWFRGNIVRCKQIMGEQYWDYGVKFSERLT